MKYVIYTSIFGDYDFIKEPFLENEKIDFICFTDNKKLKSKKWNFIYVENTWGSPIIANRFYKIIGFKDFLSNYQKSIYVDGSIVIKGNIIDLFEKYDSPFVFFKHRFRDCIFDEYDQCLIENKGDPKILSAQVISYKESKMTSDFGMSENCIIMRSHEDTCYKIMQQWWDEFLKYPSRDQISLPFVLWSNHIQYKFFEEELLSNAYFETGPHNNETIRKLWTKLLICLYGTCLYPIVLRIDRFQKKIRSK